MPEAGRVLIFQHRDLVHSGDDVLNGVKYTMRTDLMYELDNTSSTSKSYMPVLEDESSGCSDVSGGATDSEDG